MSKVALIVVDVQRDFCEGGALPAANTLSLLQPLQQCIEVARHAGAALVYTKDWHPQDHSSFRQHGGPWPVHCVAGSPGAELMPPLQARPDEIVTHKGVHASGAGYSGFEFTGLETRLRELHVQHLGISGIATEYCVRATALDALQHGFQVTLLTDLIRAVNPGRTENVFEELKKAGANTQTSTQWIQTLLQNGAVRPR